jgi:hypothetical protein
VYRQGASPFWQFLFADDVGGGQDRFFAEVRRTVAPSYAWPRPFRSTDPLYRWLLEHRFSRPATSNGRALIAEHDTPPRLPPPWLVHRSHWSGFITVSASNAEYFGECLIA